mmetsp:Transcript_26491/g.78396  ORF Transcript_26491/g.78396 Transcript_26491/m.78396 type:complete len:118 (+) Transcript_26491:139-492(+)|eukprot:CAMPEP_0113557420 /NCGR_PEP_ID=MMETSP0015_2-20120614/17784_1 /TAXON_ID=2838 /ORGANISM="Odontella" /LENGTH=117 /DNA_ID=CAMNT_0000458849 /DNA_START=138 /DNA_END=491 /DNA_ORIENTATION=- /assembly_acc=CAM_ASM_000160
MSRGKQKPRQTSIKTKKETKSERRARLDAEREAREVCVRILPYVIGGIFCVIAVFTIYVRLMPQRVTPPPQDAAINVNAMPQSNAKAAQSEIPSDILSPRFESSEGDEEEIIETVEL